MSLGGRAVGVATDPAVAMTTVDVGVRVVVRVPLRTMRHESALEPTSNILGVGDRFEVSRVDAGSIPAGVVKLKPRRDKTDDKLVGDHMSASAPLPIPVPKPSVPIGETAGEDPALAVLSDFRPEALLNRNRRRTHARTLPLAKGVS
jgi:hypothetical protein